MISIFKKPSREQFYWVAFSLVTVPAAIAARLLSLSTPFFEVHPLRQAQTALTIQYMARNESGFFDYSSPFNGLLWSWVREFPFYQWVLSFFVRNGGDLISLTRSATLLCFLFSVVSLYSLMKRLSGSLAARWATLFYFVLPFSITYSRACQVDMVALAFLIMGLDFAVAFRQTPEKRFWFLATLFLSLSGLIKLTIWCGPVVFWGLYTLASTWKAGEKRKIFWVISSLLIQGFLVCAWAYWAEIVYYRTGNDPGQIWLFGTAASRLDPSAYISLFKTFHSTVLSHWLWVPLIFGIYSLRNRRGLIFFLTCSGAFSILVFFNVSIFHHYYFLATLPAVLYLTGIGMAQLFKADLRSQRISLVILLMIFVNFNRGFVASLEDLFSHRVPEVVAYEKIKNLTDPGDVILPDEFNNSILAAYHADRLLAQIRNIDVTKMNPSVLYFQSESSLVRGFVQNQSMVAILGNFDGTYVYRLQDVGNYKFEPKKHLAVFREAAAKPALHWNGMEPLKLNVCNRNSEGVVVENLSGNSKILGIKFDKTRTEFLLPGGRYLSIPGRSSWGCSVTVQARPPKAQGGTLLAERPLIPVDRRQSSRH